MENEVFEAAKIAVTVIIIAALVTMITFVGYVSFSGGKEVTTQTEKNLTFDMKASVKELAYLRDGVPASTIYNALMCIDDKSKYDFTLVDGTYTSNSITTLVEYFGHTFYVEYADLANDRFSLKVRRVM